MVSKKKHPSPLRYPGGKACLLDNIKAIIDDNDIRGIEYAEPFAGGAGLALSLLFEGYVSQVFLNDLDTAVFALWSSLIEQTDDFCALIEQTPVTIEQWFHQKRILSNPSHYSLLELGFSAFFLNRTNRSGIILGGIIGGVHQDGKYKLDCRFNKVKLIQKIRRIASWKENISLTRFDGCEFIREVVCNNPRDCLTFIDPPYYQKGPQLYYNAFDHHDHERLAELIQNDLPGLWIVTYDDVPEIRSMYALSSEVPYEINYSLSKKRKGYEVMYHSQNLSIPSFLLNTTCT